MIEEILFKKWLEYAAAKLCKALDIEKSAAYQEANYLAKVISSMKLLSDNKLSEIAQLCLNHALEKRCNHMPLAKIAQKKAFYNHYFITTEDTLDPRPATEQIIDLIDIKVRSVLDLGTGTGCLILSILKNFPKAQGLAVDISSNALKIAQENAKILQIDKIKFKQNNWAENITGHFDLIVCNPPYIAHDYHLDKQVHYDPTISLYGNSQTYHELFHSLQNITFFQMLIEIPNSEIPNYLLDEICKFDYLKQFDYQITPGQISILNIHAKNIPTKIMQNK